MFEEKGRLVSKCNIGGTHLRGPLLLLLQLVDAELTGAYRVRTLA